MKRNKSVANILNAYDMIGLVTVHTFDSVGKRTLSYGNLDMPSAYRHILMSLNQNLQIVVTTNDVGSKLLKIGKSNSSYVMDDYLPFSIDFGGNHNTTYQMNTGRSQI